MFRPKGGGQSEKIHFIRKLVVLMDMGFFMARYCIIPPPLPSNKMLNNRSSICVSFCHFQFTKWAGWRKRGATKKSWCQSIKLLPRGNQRGPVWCDKGNHRNDLINESVNNHKGWHIISPFAIPVLVEQPTPEFQDAQRVPKNLIMSIKLIAWLKWES